MATLVANVCFYNMSVIFYYLVSGIFWHGGAEQRFMSCMVAGWPDWPAGWLGVRLAILGFGAASVGLGPASVGFGSALAGFGSASVGFGRASVGQHSNNCGPLL